MLWHRLKPEIEMAVAILDSLKDRYEPSSVMPSFPGSPTVKEQMLNSAKLLDTKQTRCRLPNTQSVFGVWRTQSPPTSTSVDVDIQFIQESGPEINVASGILCLSSTKTRHAYFRFDSRHVHFRCWSVSQHTPLLSALLTLISHSLLLTNVNTILFSVFRCPYIPVYCWCISVLRSL